MKRLACLLTLVFALAFAAGCGPDDNGNNGGGNNGGGTITADEFVAEFPQKYAEAICKSAFQCPENQSPVFATFFFGRTPTQEDCVSSLSQATGSVVPMGDLESGLVNFDPQAAQDCLDTIEQRSSGNACDIAIAGEPTPASCYNAVSGTLADGEECASDGQCQSGACEQGANPDSCTGECAPRAGEGEECEPADGQDGPTCNDLLTCVPNDSGGFECAPIGSLQEGDDCALSFATVTACTGGTQCVGEQGTGTCTSVTFVGEGADCSPDLTYCQSGLVCVEDACTVAGAAGDACMTSNLECQDGFYCDTDASECTPVKAAGDTCSGQSQCGDLECIDGTCQAPEACTLPME